MLLLTKLLLLLLTYSFLEHDDANRALMGSNMMRQAVPLLILKLQLLELVLKLELASQDSRFRLLLKVMVLLNMLMLKEIVLNISSN
jgi:DNA-directed RNA polymerase subunit beta